MVEQNLSKYSRESVKQRFEESYGKMLEESEIRQFSPYVKSQLLTLWPGENKPVYPAFQFNKNGRPNKLLKRVMEEIDDDIFVQEIIRKLFIKDGNGVTGLDLIKSGQRKKAIEWAKNFKKISTSQFQAAF